MFRLIRSIWIDIKFVKFKTLQRICWMDRELVGYSCWLLKSQLIHLSDVFEFTFKEAKIWVLCKWDDVMSTSCHNFSDNSVFYFKDIILVSSFWTWISSIENKFKLFQAFQQDRMISAFYYSRTCYCVTSMLSVVFFLSWI